MQARCRANDAKLKRAIVLRAKYVWDVLVTVRCETAIVFAPDCSPISTGMPSTYTAQKRRIRWPHRLKTSTERIATGTGSTARARAATRCRRTT
jgi:hypothetical protein